MENQPVDPSYFIDVKDPIISGEPASQDDIEVIEALAADLLSPVPAEIHRWLEVTAESGATLSLFTYIYEEEGREKINVGMSLGNANDQKNRITLGYRYDNSPLELAPSHPDDLAEAAKIAQELLDYDDFDPEMKKVVRHLQTLALNQTAYPAAKPSDEFSQLAMNGSGSHIADTVRGIVDINTLKSVQAKEYAVPLEDDETVTLYIVRQEVLGDDGVPYIAEGSAPVLRIGLEDRIAGRHYNYIRAQDGENYLALANIDDEVSSEGDTDEMDVDVMFKLPKITKAAAALITSKLFEASLIDFYPTGDSAE